MKIHQPGFKDNFFFGNEFWNFVSQFALEISKYSEIFPKFLSALHRTSGLKLYFRYNYGRDDDRWKWLPSNIENVQYKLVLIGLQFTLRTWIFRFEQLSYYANMQRKPDFELDNLEAH